MYFKIKTKGFTLIELLVVISIIALLSAVVLSSLNTARMKARDTRRMQDLAQIRRALELYYHDNGHYPYVSGWVHSSAASWSNLQTILSPYIPQLPVDPVNNGPNPWAGTNLSYSYGVHTTGGNVTPSQYDLVTRFEDTSNPNRCAVKGWIYYTGGNGRPWCQGTHGKPNPHNYSGQIYVDH